MPSKKLSSKQVMYLLVLIIFLGAFLRFYNLGGESFWLDEGTTSLTIKKHSALEIIQNVKEHGQILPEYYSFGTYRYDEDLPAYYIFLSGWTNVFGMSEFAFRSMSALLSSLTIFLVFYLSRYLFDEKIALLSSFFTSINLTLLWYSQEARQYSFLLFLSILSVIFLLKAIKENKIGFYAGLLLVNSIIIYSHFPWIMFIFFEGLYALFVIYSNYKEKHVLHKRLIVTFLVIGLLYMPIIGRALFSDTLTTDLYGKPGIAQIGEFGVQLSTWLYPSIGMRQEFYDKTFNFTFYEWSLLFSALLTAGLASILFLLGLKKSLKKKDSAVFLYLMFFAPVIFALIISWIHPDITVFQLKQMIYIIPAFLIFVSIGISKSKFALPLIIILALSSVLPIFAYYTNIDKQQFREASQFLTDDELIFLNIETAEVIFQFYDGERDNIIGVTTIEQLESNLKNEDSFWLLLTFTKYSDPANSMKSYLNQNYELIEKNNEFFDIELLHYRKK